MSTIVTHIPATDYGWTGTAPLSFVTARTEPTTEPAVTK